MLTELRGIPVWLTVISAGRHKNVKPLTEMIGAASWYVPPRESPLYHQEGAHTRLGSDIHVVPIRNRALTEAFAHGAICVQLDDDLKWAAFASNGKAQRTEPRRLLEVMVERLMDSDFRFAGAAPTNNAYFTRKQNSTNLFIRSGAIALKPNPLRFDENLRVKFDYDLTIQHYLRFGGVLRCDNLIFDFEQRTNTGGHVSDHRATEDEAAIEYLMKKWPGLVIRHPRREHEVLLRLPRHKREVLA